MQSFVLNYWHFMTWLNYPQSMWKNEMPYTKKYDFKLVFEQKRIFTFILKDDLQIFDKCGCIY